MSGGPPCKGFTIRAVTVWKKSSAISIVMVGYGLGHFDKKRNCLKKIPRAVFEPITSCLFQRYRVDVEWALISWNDLRVLLSMWYLSLRRALLEVLSWLDMVYGILTRREIVKRNIPSSCIRTYNLLSHSKIWGRHWMSI